MDALPPRDGSTPSKRRRFRPWENLRRIFQRKSPRADSLAPSAGSSPACGAAVGGGKLQGSRLLSNVFSLASRSRSISELIATEPQPIPGSNVAMSNSAVLAPAAYSSGLSVSHDSVFGQDVDTSFNAKSAPLNSSASSASAQYLSELRAAICRRRSTDEDEGLPHSPLNDSLTTAEVLAVNFSMQGNPSHSTGSDASLLSVGSCETEEEALPFVSLQQPRQQVHKASAKAQLHPARAARSAECHGMDLSDEVLSSAIPGSAWPLSHSAARHKMAVRPKKNHAPARHRLLPQLSENLPSTPEVNEEASSVQPALPSAATLHPVAPPVAAERKSRPVQTASRDQPPIPKLRSLSLSRTENSLLQVKCVDDQQMASPSAANPVTKLSRSKSSVEKKIQHEVAFFWKRHNLRKESTDTSASTGRLSGSSTELSASGGGRQRKDLRKIKRDKEEKRKRGALETSSTDSPPPASQPFLSRLFGSRRSSRKKKNSDKNEQQVAPTVIKSASSQSVPSLKSVHDDKGYESLVLAAETVAPPAAEDADDGWIQPSLNPALYGDRPRKTSQELNLKGWSPLDENPSRRYPLGSPQAPRNRIHIAGLSPYQRRVARIGNGLEISDDEWDEDPVDRVTDFGPPVGRLSSASNLNSLPVNINQDFILKRPPTGSSTSDNIRRSLEILKDSNEGLMKAIGSLNHRLSQSSDQLAGMSDDSARRSGSISTGSTSSLNISDTEATPLSSLTDSKESLNHAVDEMVVQDHHPAGIAFQVEDLKAATPPDEVAEPNKSPTDAGEYADGAETRKSASPIQSSSPSVPEFLHVHLTPVEVKAAGSNVIFDTERIPAPPVAQPRRRKSTEDRKFVESAPEAPVFSMSVRVQNPSGFQPPSANPYSRSLSHPLGGSGPMSVQDRPVIVQLKQGHISNPDADSGPSSLSPKPSGPSSIAKFGPRPWQAPESSKLRQQPPVQQPPPVPEKVIEVIEAPVPQIAHESNDSAPEEVKLRRRKGSAGIAPPTPQADTCELMKVFARRSLKLRDSSDDNADSEPDPKSAAPETHPEPVNPAGTALKSVTSVQIIEKAPTVTPPAADSETNGHATPAPPVAAPRSIPVLMKIQNRQKEPAAPHAATPLAPAVAPAVVHPPEAEKPSPEESADDREPNMWKKMIVPKKLVTDRFTAAVSAPTADGAATKVVEAPKVTPPRQSKVLDMVHNFQRLQVT